MKILAIETSSERGSVALQCGEQQITRVLDGQRNHSALLLPTIRSLLAEAGWGLAQLDGIAFGAGPGAFTGVRLACGVAQGLSLGSGLPLAPVNCLAALAVSTSTQEGNVLAVRDARMGEIYWQSFRLDQGSPTSLTEPVCTAAGEMPQLPGTAWLGVGSGFLAWPELATHLAGQLIRVEASQEVEAWAIAKLGAYQIRAGKGVRSSEALPLYVRNKVALTTAERLAKGGRA